MALIIEGGDNLGKTTAAKRLVQLANERGKFPIRYSHMSRPPQQFDFFDDYTKWTTPFTVQDRFHLGALVWHEDVLPTHALRIVEGWLLSEASVVVVFYVPFSQETEYYERLISSNRPEMFSIDAIMEGQRKFRTMIFDCVPSGMNISPHIDFAIPIYPDGYIDDKTMNTILDEWFKRLELVYGFRARKA